MGTPCRKVGAVNGEHANKHGDVRKALRHGRRYKGGGSHIYMRLLHGEISAERYVAVVKRAVRMRLGLPHTHGWEWQR